MRKAVVVAIVTAWLFLLWLTHFGGKSPYSYGWAMFPLQNETAKHMHGAAVNPDSFSATEVSLFFYDGRLIDWGGAPNLDLPLHAFSVATLAGITRGTLSASFLANILFFVIAAIAGLNLADRHGIHRGATLVTLLTVYSLPVVLDYIGQPLHYMVGISASFLVVLSMVAMDDISPWVAALAVSILLLNYDPYVFLCALVTWLLFVRRFAKWWHAVVFLVLAPLPKILWTRVLKWASQDTVSTMLRDWFFRPVMNGWKELVAEPLDNALQPFVASHVGVHVAVHQIISMIYWPLVAACVALLFRLRPRVDRRWMLLALLPVFLFLEQFVAAGWDWELNPRRALPVVLAFAVAWCWSAHQVWDRRWGRAGFIAMFVLSAFLALSDTLLHDPALAYLRTGQAMSIRPQEALVKENMRLYPYYMPKLVPNLDIDWTDLDTVRIERKENRRTIFAASQAVGLYLLVGLFWLAARARILPRWAPWGALGVWLVSLARFL
ncbi:MAG TPA: hypothetical protein VNI54_00955 [Thermoanaerobaculia bacterium]|nr:hypothetical protein [Thermoanaerobaculia bacterium]